jgi:hypothetical protein
MAHNPYTPPAAHVDDSAPATWVDPEGGRDVFRACVIFWVSFGLSAVTDLFEIFRSIGGPIAIVVGTIVGMTIGLGVGLLITWWFTSRLKRGRNWMRIRLTALALLSIASSILFWNWYRDSVLPLYESNPVLAVLGGLQFLLWLASLLLLYTPRSNAWFAAMKTAR